MIYMPKMEVPNITRIQLLSRLSESGLDSNNLVRKALDQAFRSHHTQERDDGSSYLEQHVYAVTASIIEYRKNAQKQVTPELIAGALLHDVLEDDEKVTDDQFKLDFGDRIFSIVKPLSKKDYRKYPGETKRDMKYALNRDYFAGLERAPNEAKIIKLADRLNNIMCIHLSPKQGKLDFYIEETEKFYLPFAEKVSPYYYSKIEEQIDMLKASNGT